MSLTLLTRMPVNLTPVVCGEQEALRPADIAPVWVADEDGHWCTLNVSSSSMRALWLMVMAEGTEADSSRRQQKKMPPMMQYSGLITLGHFWGH